jgi:hypothetical protein
MTDLPAINSPLGGLHWTFTDDLYSSANTRGLYNPLHFVVRLRREFHALLTSGPSGSFTLQQTDVERLPAFLTFFHECIHWCITRKRPPDPYLPGRVCLSAGVLHSWEARDGTTAERPG